MSLTELGCLILAYAVLLSLLLLILLVIDYRQSRSKSPALPPMNTQLAEFKAAALERASDEQRQKIEGGNVVLLAELVETIKSERIPSYKELQEKRADLVAAREDAMSDASFWHGIPRMFGGPGEYNWACAKIRECNDAISEVDRQLNP